MLTARDTESDTVLGLESGADDYLTKPFGVRELMARVGAITAAPSARRGAADGGASASACSRATSTLDAERRAAVVRGEPVELTKQEFDLLYLLAARPGIVFSRAALLSKVWSGDTYVTERTVDTVISRLRRKIERDPQDPELHPHGVGRRLQVRRRASVTQQAGPQLARYDGSSGGCCGSVIVNAVRPGPLVTAIVPPWRSTIAFAIESPRPLPLVPRARDESTL